MDDVVKTGSSNIYSKLAEERIFFIGDMITQEVANRLVAHLIFLDKKSPTEEITVVINSCGSDVQEGLLPIYDAFQVVRAPIKTICIGQAYSGAAILLAAGTKGRRFAYADADVMIHTVQVAEISGTQSQLEDESRRTKRLNGSLMELIARHTGQSLRKVKRDCSEDKYMTAKEALEYGIIDEIIKSEKELPPLKK